MPVNEQKTERYGFLLIPEYSMMAFAAAVDQLRMANRLSSQPLYEWVVCSEGTGPVVASNELSVTSTPIAECEDLDALFVCGGVNVESKTTRPVINWLRELAA